MPAPPRAVIDCGTNTFHLSIVDGNNPAIQVFSQRIPVRIGEGGFRTQIIRSERLARALDALKTLQETSWNYGVEDISVVATSAVRDASNRDAFLRAVREKTGLEVVVLSGLDEARLIQAGVEPTCPAEEHGPWLTMDIGGGSVELVVWSSDLNFKRSHFSCDIGVGRLQDFGTPPDPLGAAGAAKFRAYLEGALGEVTAVTAATPPMRLVGSSGSFETFADCLGLPLTDRTQAIPLPRKEFSELSTHLQSVDLSERLTLRGMAPDRAPFIALSAMLVDTMLAHLPANATVWASPAALREGVVRAGAEEGGLAAFLQSPHHTAP